MDLVNFNASHGRLPLNGLELCPGAAELAVDASTATEAEMHDLASRCIKGINPITGKFYTSFNTVSWAPGAILLECIDDPEIVREQIGNLNLAFDPNNPMDPAGSTVEPVQANRIWHLTIWGETEGSVLIEAEYWTE